MTENKRGRRNEVTGQVISDKMDKTVTVRVYRVVKHPRYKKYVRRTSVFTAHDENNTARIGDMVRIFETHAISKTKHWKMAEVVKSQGGGQ